MIEGKNTVVVILIQCMTSLCQIVDSVDKTHEQMLTICRSYNDKCLVVFVVGFPGEYCHSLIRL